MPDSTDIPVLVNWFEFRLVLALADAFGFRVHNLDWYLDFLDKDPPTDSLRWWEVSIVDNVRFSAAESWELARSLSSVERWLADKPDRVPDAANMHDAVRFYDLLKFVRKDNAPQIVKSVRVLAEGGPILWKNSFNASNLLEILRDE